MQRGGADFTELRVDGTGDPAGSLAMAQTRGSSREMGILRTVAFERRSCIREAAMNVKTILAAKQRNLGGDIVSIEPTANLAAAAKVLSPRPNGGRGTPAA